MPELVRNQNPQDRRGCNTQRAPPLRSLVPHVELRVRHLHRLAVEDLAVGRGRVRIRASRLGAGGSWWYRATRCVRCSDTASAPAASTAAALRTCPSVGTLSRRCRKIASGAGLYQRNNPEPPVAQRNTFRDVRNIDPERTSHTKGQGAPTARGLWPWSGAATAARTAAQGRRVS
jgi:hypothetical protein